MKPEALILALLSVCMSALAQVLLKFGMASGAVQQSLASPLSTLLVGLRSVPVLLGLCLYAAGALVWLLVLARVDVSAAYPFVGLGIVLTGIAGAVLLDEPLSALRVVGSLLVITGVLLVGKS